MITIDPPSSSTPDRSALSKDALTRFLRRAQREAGVAGSVDVLLTSDRELRRLNRSFRGKDRPTDVLSFPAPSEVASRCAGDLAISVDTAARQATRFGHSLSDEVRILLLHGLLHLHGMDHETDAGEMAAAEHRLRLQLRLPDTLIARTTSAATMGHARRHTPAAITRSPRTPGVPRPGRRADTGAAR